MSGFITFLHIRAISQCATRGILQAGSLAIACSLGRTGCSARKREGDGATPAGAWRLRRIFYRGDRLLPPRAWRAPKVLRPGDGWCEKVGDRNYNRRVALPYPAAHESMCRTDHLYDIVVELSHNERPRIQGHGSAVFLHLRRPDGLPTAGCIAVSLRDMKLLLARCGPRTRLVIGPYCLRPAKRGEEGARREATGR